MDIQVYIMSKRAFLFKMSDSACMNSLLNYLKHQSNVGVLFQNFLNSTRFYQCFFCFLPFHLGSFSLVFDNHK